MTCPPLSTTMVSVEASRERPHHPGADTAPDVAVGAPEPLRGLSSRDAAERLRREGPNSLPEPPAASPMRLLVAQMTHFFALMLWSAAVLALVAGMPVLAVRWRPRVRRPEPCGGS